MAKSLDAEAPEVAKTTKGNYKEFFPDQNVSFWKKIFFLDIDPLIIYGHKVALQSRNLFHYPELETETIYTVFDTAYKKRAAAGMDMLDIKWPIIAGNGFMLLITGILYAFSQGLSLAGPLLLQEIVAGIQCQGVQKLMPEMVCRTKGQLYLFCIGLILAPVLQSFCENHATFQLFVIGTKMRNALMSAIYRKCLRLSSSSLQAVQVGKIVTLMSNDAQKMQDVTGAFHFIWFTPLFIIVVLALLWLQVGWATLVGLAIMLLLGPITGVMAARLGMLRREILKWTDKRVSVMSEMISNIQIIKFYAWESPFKSEVKTYRDGEASVLRRMAVYQAVFSLVVFGGPIAVSVFTFGAYTLSGNELPISRAYAALALFGLLRFPMSFLPMMITMLINALVSLRRIAGFLAMPEVETQLLLTAPPPSAAKAVAEGVVEDQDAPSAPPAPADLSPTASEAALGAVAGSSGSDSLSVDGPGELVVKLDDEAPTKGIGKFKEVAPGWVVIEHATFAWGKPAPSMVDEVSLGPGGPDGKVGLLSGTAEEAKDMKEVEEEDLPPTLSNIHLNIKPGNLVMVIGGVGSGKSSLVAAMLGLIPVKEGHVSIGGSIAYVAQSAWIMNETVQENVLFGEDMDPVRYQMAMETAQLLPDIGILPKGDLTEIGDKGINLSGGQKQRVSIARAIYANADVCIFDDPLSAVDAHVNAALFEKVMCGVLKGKTIILVTNALQHLQAADLVVWVDGGVIRAQGSYKEVVDAGLDLKDLVHLDEEDEEEAVDEYAVMEKALHLEHTVEAVEEDMAGTVAVFGKPGNARRSSMTRASIAKKSALRAKLTLRRVAVDTDRNLTGTEEREEGNLGWHVVSRYMKMMGPWISFIFLFCLYCAEQGSKAYNDTWVGIWFGDKYGLTLGAYLGIYAGLGLAYGLLTLVRSMVFAFMCVRASVGLHNAILDHMLVLPKAFFDTNPSGRILNRFSRDTEIVDTVLVQSLVQFVGCVAQYISILIVISIATKWFAIGLVPMTVVYYFIQRFYIPAAREIQRLESLSRSPIYSRFSETLAGVATIRAYRKEDHFQSMGDILMHSNADAFLTQKLAAAWLAMRLDALGVLVIAATGFLCIATDIDPGMAGLALAYALDLTKFLKHGTAMASKTETDFNSAERMIQYLDPEPEADHESEPKVLEALPKQWPAEGEVRLEKLCMAYRPGLPLVLNEVSFTCHAGEKVGIVGRTGGGKSSLFVALFRMVEPCAGTVYIDGVDYRTLGLATLRSRMSIIPQDPFMFSGTVRRNMDPFSEFDDEQLWAAIESAGLKAAITATSEKLDSVVADNGANFSLGQRQLFCMARAMLRNCRILMLDEATASVDLDTDAALQIAIRERFVTATTLTIAHRLSTVVDNDRVIVMSEGRVAENDVPDDLLARDNGMFTSMVNQTGKGSSRYLRDLASSARRGRVDMLDSDGLGVTASVLSQQKSRSRFGLSASTSTGRVVSSAALDGGDSHVAKGSGAIAVVKEEEEEEGEAPEKQDPKND